MSSGSGEQQACLRAASARSLVSVLHSIKPANTKQECVLLIGPEDGLSVRLEDESKTLQSSIFMRPDLFSAVHCPAGRQIFGVQFGLLLDTLQVFASAPGLELELRYPGPNQELVLEMMEDADSTVCTYARIATVEMQIPTDLLDFWQEPASFFIMSGGLLKEAVDDLEWAAAGGHQSARGNVHLLIRSHPRAVTMRASGAGALEVDFPLGDGDDPHGFACVGREVKCYYKHKHLRAAFSNIPAAAKDGSNVSTKVMIDSQGLMKVMHMITVHAAGDGMQRVPTQGATQGMLERKCVVQFTLLPEEDYTSE
jgi:cell cycle checkpoint protein